MWAKIATTYKRFYPDEKLHNGEECRKQWDRIRATVSRFVGLYANNLRMKTSGQTDDDVRRMAEAAFSLKGVYKEFTFWNCYEVLMDSEKFQAGVDAGWPKKQQLNLASDYSSRSGSHELPDDAQEFPSPPSLLAALARLVKRGRNRELGAPPTGPRRSSRHPPYWPVGSRALPPRASTNAGEPVENHS